MGITLSSTLSFLLVFAVTLSLGALATLVTRAVAWKVGFVAKPRAERWHQRPTALAGGVGIFMAFAPAAAVVGGPLAWRTLPGAAAMFLLGLVDDIRPLAPRGKLLAQVAVAVATVLSGAMLPWTTFPVVNGVVTVVWLVGLTNAINLLDNMDGLSGGVSCISALSQGLFFALAGRHAEAALCASLAGALAGFLVFNVNPASIFMGDAGALFLGYTLATLALHQDYGRTRGLLSVVAAPVLVLLAPITDTTFVTVTRILRGRPVSQGGRDHTSHRLVLLGLSERGAVGVLWGVAALGGGVGLLVSAGPSQALWAAVPLLVVALALALVHLGRAAAVDGTAKPPATVLRAIGLLGHKRRLFEALLDALLAVASLSAAFMLRFDGEVPAEMVAALARAFPLLLGFKLIALGASGAYATVWRRASSRDVLRQAAGALAGGLVGLGAVGALLGFQQLSRGALVLDAILFTAFLLASRAWFTLLGSLLRGRQGTEEARRVVLWGADDRGAALARLLLLGEGRVPVGFVDDDELLAGRTVLGLPVLGDSSRLGDLVLSGVADEVLITTDRVTDEQLAAVRGAVGEGRVRRVRLVEEPV